ncbi:DUF1592 domain-containing protein [Planctomicrobium sp. SH668]|uniref:DUF1592 domain-containing protein n=1 Tax=Planctomicrobium sp. SH668 TaxID=3448126 RepID=UPI003F5C864A
MRREFTQQPRREYGDFKQRRFAVTCMRGLLIVISCGAVAKADQQEVLALEKPYLAEVRPLLAKYCQDCHSDDLAEAELNLQGFDSLEVVRKHPVQWQLIEGMLHTGQMPPKDSPQPSEAEKKTLHNWVKKFLTLEAKAFAGDPGPVVLRRLSNSEYTNTLRDLTGVPGLNPAEEFPVDGAAGEGFTNTGNALVMSPALLVKYLDAAKEVSAHSVLLPDGFRFSQATTQRDQTDEMLGKIRGFYSKYTDPRVGEKVNLQGIVFNTNDGGGLPIEKYLIATVSERELLQSKSKTVAQVAEESGLSAKYLQLLWDQLNAPEQSPVLGRVQEKWRKATVENVPELVEEISSWQKGLWTFSNIGHIGKLNGPKSWLEPLTPLGSQQELRFKIPANVTVDEVGLSLVAANAGDGVDSDVVIWERPRLVSPGKPEILLRDIPLIMQNFEKHRARILDGAEESLAAIDDLIQRQVEPAAIVKEKEIDEVALHAWMRYLGVGSGPTRVQGHFTSKHLSSGGYDFVQGWHEGDLPAIWANSSDQEVRIPGLVVPHGVVVHPSPTHSSGVVWESPVDGAFQIEGTVQPAHALCGNGISWSIELRRGSTRQLLASGDAGGQSVVPYGPFPNISIQKGDSIALMIGARNQDHSCDLTAINLKLIEQGAGNRVWELAPDVSGDILASNPHADRLGNPQVWHFVAEATSGGSGTVQLPVGSLLANWQIEKDPQVKQQLAAEFQKLLSGGAPADDNSPNAKLYRQMMSFDGPAMWRADMVSEASQTAEDQKSARSWGIAADYFGDRLGETGVDRASLVVKAPSVEQFTLPASLVAGYDFVVTGKLAPQSGREGSVQLAVTDQKLSQPLGGASEDIFQAKPATAATPIVVNPGSAAHQKWIAAFDEFRNLFPTAICYAKIVPVDEVVTLTLFYREDDHLCRLMLNDQEKAELDRLWSELRYISQDALATMDAFEQIWEYTTQDGDTRTLEPLRAPLQKSFDDFIVVLKNSEAKHIDHLLVFAEQAYRRPISEIEQQSIRNLYQALRAEELSHVDAFRLTLAKVLMSPDFLYHVEKPGEGAEATRVSDWELASRLSYFLWSSQPDAELYELAAAGKLGQPEVLKQQARRMLADPKARRLATEFTCQWLHIYDFNSHDEKSEQHFPAFSGLRDAMYEESILFFLDLFQNNRSVVSLLDADHTYLNEALAGHYGIPGVEGEEWRRVDGIREQNRGGILAMASTLSKQSGASRTSPTLRGNWVSEVLLGERVPRPPKDVPTLPEDPDAFVGLTVRELVELHAKDEKCAVCHVRIDPIGFSLEHFDAIGKFREKDHGDLPIDTSVETVDGLKYEGLDGLRNHLLSHNKDAFVRQFSKKLLGYSLGRAVQLSDEPLLEEIQDELKSNDYQVQIVIDKIIESPQFLEIRGRDAAFEDLHAAH